MKTTRWMSTAFFSLVLGATTLICTPGLHAQDQRDDAKPEQKDTQPDANKDATKPDTAKPADEAKSPKQDQAKPTEQDNKSAKPAEN